jgi:hypothetical protein
VAYAVLLALDYYEFFQVVVKNGKKNVNISNGSKIALRGYNRQYLYFKDNKTSGAGFWSNAIDAGEEMTLVIRK